MLKLGYTSRDFMNLSDSFSDGGSQEVLLASGWLISTLEIMDIFISKFHSNINNEYFVVENFYVSTLR